MSASFEDLIVWQRSCNLTIKLYKLLKNWKDYGLKDQILRAAVSIASNIAEGSERKSVADFSHFLNIAKGSAAELRTQVYIAQQVGLLESEVSSAIINELKEISRMLQGLASSLSRTGH
jgi:four helix bundle protein